MKLKNAAKFFDTCPVYDGYSGSLLFRVQSSTFLESAAEGTTSSRRIISTAPEVTIPSHSALLVLGDLLIVGGQTKDEWAGTTLRKAHWTKRVTDSVSVLSPAEACLNTAVAPVFGQKHYLRETLNSQTDAELDPMWSIYLSASLSPSRGYYLKTGTTLHRVRVSMVDIDGFRTCMSDEVDEPVATLSVAGVSTFNPVLDTYVTSMVTAKGILLDYAKVFTKQTQQDYKVAPGDICVVVPKVSVVPSVGLEFSINSPSKFSGSWRTLNIVDEHDGWLLHVRRK